MTFKIKNLKVWGIENLSAEILLQGDFDDISKDILQGEKVNKLISDRETIKEAIFEALKDRPINKNGPTLEEKYGIEVVSFVLNETRFGDKLVEATEEKKHRQLIAEADNYAADQEADRIKKLYKAYLEGIQSLHIALGGSQTQQVNPAGTAILDGAHRWKAYKATGNLFHGAVSFTPSYGLIVSTVTLVSLDAPEVLQNRSIDRRFLHSRLHNLTILLPMA